MEACTCWSYVPYQNWHVEPQEEALAFQDHTLRTAGISHEAGPAKRILQALFCLLPLKSLVQCQEVRLLFQLVITRRPTWTSCIIYYNWIRSFLHRSPHSLAYQSPTPNIFHICNQQYVTNASISHLDSGNNKCFIIPEFCNRYILY